MATTLTIRNLASVPIELKLLDRYDAAYTTPNPGYFSHVSRAFTSFRAKSPSSPELAAKSESFKTQELSIPISPFETKITDIQSNGQETLRLTFEADGQRYRLDVPTPSLRSTVLTPLASDPRFEFTAVHLPDAAHLAIYSTAKLDSWMSKLKDETPLSALSIPGTHNSPTYHVALPSVRCQSASVQAQLENGVRFLDIRVQPESPSDPSKDALVLVHSAFPVSLTGAKYFRGLMDRVFAFLDANPTETVIISVKREGVGKSTDQQLSKILHTHYAADPNRWWTINRLPTLGETRSKVVLIRRFAIDDSLKSIDGGAGFAIDAESWPDNCADGVCSSGEIRVQDFYEVAESVNIEKKITYSTDQLARSAQILRGPPGESDPAHPESKQPFFMNFLSASNFWRANCWPDRIAAKVNPSVISYLCRHHNEVSTGKPVGDGSTGIVVCDWVGHGGDWDLVRCIVGMNAKLEMK